MEWLPIESAPKDGTEILLFQPSREIPYSSGTGSFKTGSFTTLCEWSKDDYWGDGWRVCGGRQETPMMLRGEAPTHWMPLPPPPASTLEG